MKYLGLICARGGSKGIPKKNIKKINGHPLIAWTIALGNSNSRLSRLIVSTEDYEIQEISKKYGAEVPFIRPKELALDNTPEWLVWRHAINFIDSSDNGNFDAIVILPTTSPLRLDEDIEKAISLYEKEDCDAVISVKNASRNPYFNMTKLNSEGYSEIVLKPESHIFNRQSAPQIYDMTTVIYIVDSNYVRRKKHLFEGNVKQIIIPEERAIDIDNQLDFELAEFLLSSNNYKILNE